MNKTLCTITALAATFFATSASAGGHYVSMGAPGGKQIVYHNGTSDRSDVMMPGTNRMVHGRRMNIMTYRHGVPMGALGGGATAVVGSNYAYRHTYRGHRFVMLPGGHAGSGSGAPIRPRPNPTKEKYLADCAAEGAPVTRTAGGGMNCYRAPTVTTFRD